MRAGPPTSDQQRKRTAPPLEGAAETPTRAAEVDARCDGIGAPRSLTRCRARRPVLMGAEGASPSASHSDASRLGVEGVGNAGVCEAAVGAVGLGRADEGRIVGVAELTDLA